MTRLTSKLFPIIKDCWADFLKLKDLGTTVKPSIPILWFGDLEKYWNSPIRILTVALNPSDKEFHDKKHPQFDIGLRFPAAAGLGANPSLNDSDVAAYYKAMNEYFEYNPYTTWFNKFNRHLKHLNATYYGNNTEYANRAIHIDLMTPIATDPTWGDVANKTPYLETSHYYEDLIAIFDPQIILISVGQNHIWQRLGVHLHAHAPYVEARRLRNGSLMIAGNSMIGDPFRGQGMTDQYVQERMAAIVREYNLNVGEVSAAAVGGEAPNARPRNAVNDRGLEQDLAQYEHIDNLRLWKRRQHQRNALVVNVFLKLLAEHPVGERSVPLDAFQQAIDESYGKHVPLRPFTHAYRNNDAYIFDLNGNTCTIREVAWKKLVEIGWTHDLRQQHH